MLIQGNKPTLRLFSYGLKNNKGGAADGFRSLPVADLYIDCRGVFDGTGGFASGKLTTFQSKVIEESSMSILSFQRVIEDSLKQIPRRRNDQADPYAKPYVICFMCAHGIHRSVASKILVGERLVKAGYKVEIA